MLKQESDSNGEFAFLILEKLVGGAKKYWESEQTVAFVWATCQSNANIKRLAGMYLAGSSERAERNLANLKLELVRVFDLDLEVVA